MLGHLLLPVEDNELSRRAGRHCQLTVLVKVNDLNFISAAVLPGGIAFISWTLLVVNEVAVGDLLVVRRLITFPFQIVRRNRISVDDHRLLGHLIRTDLLA